MNEEQRLRANISRSALYKVFMGSFAFDVPTIVLLWQANGFTMSDVMLLQALFAGALAALEVPSGYLADRLGRSVILRGAAVSLAVGTMLYTQAHSFFDFFVGEMFLALGFSLASGADQALLFESLRGLGRESEFSRIWGRTSAIGLFSWGAFSILGGFLGAVDLRAPLYFTLIGTGVLVLAASGLSEPSRQGEKRHEGSWQDLKSVFKESFFNQRSTRWIMLYPAVILACNQGGLWLYQPYFLELELEVQYFGLLFGLFNLVAAAASHYGDAVFKRVGPRWAAFGITSALLGSFLIMGASVSAAGLAAILLQQVIRGTAGVVFAHELNVSIDSRLRATTLSVQSLLSRALYAALIIPVGWWSDESGLQVAIFALAALSAGCIALAHVLCWGSEEKSVAGKQEAVV